MSDTLHIFVLEECDTEEDRWDYCTRAWEWLQDWKVPDEGAKHPCVPWGDFDLTIQEAKRRVNEMMSLIGDKESWVKCFFKAPRRLLRRRKNAPTHIRVKARLMGGFKRRGKNGEWFAPETNKQMAKAMGVSESTIERAFKKLADDPDLKFRVMAAEKGRGHKRVVALVSWLKYDEEPMLFDVEGKSRQIYTSMRKDREQIKPVKRITFKRPRHGRRTTNRHFCLSYSIRDKSQQNQKFNKLANAKSLSLAGQYFPRRDGKPRIPNFNRLAMPRGQVFWLASWLIANGIEGRSAWANVIDALKQTDRDMQDYPVRYPMAYACEILKASPNLRRYSRRDKAKEKRKYWSSHLEKYEANLLEAIEKNDVFGEEFIRQLIARCQAKLVA